MPGPPPASPPQPAAHDEVAGWGPTHVEDRLTRAGASPSSSATYPTQRHAGGDDGDGGGGGSDDTRAGPLYPQAGCLSSTHTRPTLCSDEPSPRICMSTQFVNSPFHA